ncbi:MAG TPA: 16S rRNA (adenine(1518)-N(6)/adenine(1519)-N(6))-dimethyltransferase RsmA [Syntrophorhabdaceae bacterium]|nr:16S rRNA (adenine(1518)-N(6)/adenine(1519)-N(6))-dimethyltransferase RsmA [Syntrophorhabdaceae bacterium]HQM80331.1 16S rRNA (adenine(1518)-N(6)/adenine(1519)-N(6))-dimethyltransferase RsmA [Syntrophorhabdaceae bacterium]
MLKKSLSQHLIKDKNILKKMVSLAQVERGDVVVEIGAGHGDLTKALAEKAGRVYAVELDGSLRNRLDPLEDQYKNLKIIYGNVLDVPFGQFGCGKSIKVVANIPYKITAPILFKLIGERPVIHSAYLTVQREIGERITSRPFSRSYGALSVVCQLVAGTKILLYLKPGLFIPPPKVESAYVAMVFKNEGKDDMDEDMTGFIKACFEHKRKQLRQALVRRYGEKKTTSLYASMCFPPSVRAEEIEPERFKTMYAFLNSGDKDNP